MLMMEKSQEETRIIYHVDDEDTPYLVKLPKPTNTVTLADFKAVLSLPKPNYKFFFKSTDFDFGVVKEEIVDDEATLPLFKGRVVAWLVSADGSNVSDGSNSQITEISGQANHHHNNNNSNNNIHHHHQMHHQHSNNGHMNAHTQPQSSHQRLGPIGDSRPMSYHSRGSMLDESGATTCTETDSVISSRKGHFNKHHHHHHHCGCDSSVMTSDIDTTSFIDSEEDEEETTSRISTTTDETSVSRIHASRHRRRRRRPRMPSMSRASSISSITDSTMSLNIITVTLNLDTVNFLGISIVGQSNKNGDGGIYVGSIMSGGAVAQDGRIEPGDMILQVNDVNFENMSNDEAVRVLREAVQKPGPIKLVVVKCWDLNPKGYFTVPRSEPVRPIDPGAWVAHTEAARASSEYLLRPESVSTLTSTSSSITSSFAETERQLSLEGTQLSVDMDMHTIAKAMALPDSGLDVKDRMWLKIVIPKAFLGSDVVEWLYSHVIGFQDRREARKYGAQMLKLGFIKHTVNKSSFSEQCYYQFGEMLTALTSLNKLTLDEHNKDNLIDPIQCSPGSPWNGSGTRQLPSYTGTYMQSSAFNAWGGETVNYGVFGAGPLSKSTHSCSSGDNALGERLSISPGASSDQISQRSGPIHVSTFQQHLNKTSHFIQQPPFAPHPPNSNELTSSLAQTTGTTTTTAPGWLMDSSANLGHLKSHSNSSESGQSSLNTQSTRDTTIGFTREVIGNNVTNSSPLTTNVASDSVIATTLLPATTSSSFTNNGSNCSNGNNSLNGATNHHADGQSSSDADSSRQSFRMAMGNPCEFYVDVM